ncbi:MAG: hypothetical protein KAT68_18850 [Bacteroidales bacterium]|nr:hypothetical protein [Bacteroidales bacterium]
MKNIILITQFIFICYFTYSQSDINIKKDSAVFKDYQPGYYENSILRDVLNIEQKTIPHSTKKYFVADYSNQKFPVDLSEYKTYWHNNPVSQGNTGTCWCFSATSFFETEIFRTTGQKIKLSEAYTFYWEYVERAIDFVKTRGKTFIAQGSEAKAVINIWEKYGIVPYSEYTGLIDGRKHHHHDLMFDKIKQYLEHIKETEQWNEKTVTTTVKSILNKYLGEPPSKILVDGNYITPVEFLNKNLKLKLNEYFSFMSLKKERYFEKHELIEPDNWRHDKDYYNIPLDDYFKLITETIEKGYTISICGDVSEPGLDKINEITKIPSFDIPSEYIDEDARQFRLSNYTTTDDHCLHIVGYSVYNDEYWFLIKDSGSRAFDGPNKGYMFYHEDYIRLKMMNILVHVDPARPVLDKIIK